MTVLIHNTSRKNAARILKQRRILATVEPHRAYDHRSGPFFTVEGQEGSELPSGGERHEMDLIFECGLPVIILDRAEINRAVNSGHEDALRGKLIIGRNDISGAIEQAIILPDLPACLRLVRSSPPPARGLLDMLLNRPEDVRLFDVALPTRAAFRTR